MSEQETAKKPNGAFNFSIDLLLGGVAAAIAKTLCAPIERVKLIL